MLRPSLLVLFLLTLGWINSAEATRIKRGAPITNVKLWDKTIPYILDDRYTDEQKTLLKAQIKKINDSTCLTFEENGQGPKLEYYLAENDKCHTDIGDTRTETENHKILLAGSCITGMRERTVIHETMHALGFAHTHTRTDRDEYITFVEGSVPKERENNFEKSTLSESATNYNIPYEYNSVMHYFPSTGFEINPEVNALAPKDIDYTNTVGGIRPVFNDWKMVNMHYKCNGNCPNTECQNDGYPNPRNCEQCVCPQFFEGKYCETARDTVILSPGDPKVVNYTQPFNEITANDETLKDDPSTYARTIPQILKAPVGTQIRVTIYEITDTHNSRFGCQQPRCDLKALEIVDGDLTRVGKRFCCNPHRPGVTFPYTFLSTGNILGYVIYSYQGMDFTVNVTFTVEGSAPVSPHSTDPIEETASTTTTTTAIPDPSQPENPQTDPPEATEKPEIAGVQTDAPVTEGPKPIDPTQEGPQTATDLSSVEGFHAHCSAMGFQFTMRDHFITVNGVQKLENQWCCFLKGETKDCKPAP